MTGERNINRKQVNYRKAGKIKKKLHKQQSKKAALANKTQQPKTMSEMTKKDRREQVKKQRKQEKKQKKRQQKEASKAVIEEEQ